MPELPEVEVLVRHLDPLLRGQIIRSVDVRREKVVAPSTPDELHSALCGARFTRVTRRGKFLAFQLGRRNPDGEFILLGHLGMTGRMYLQTAKTALPKHAAVVLGLAGNNFVFEDTRYFGRLTLDASALEKLGTEPLGSDFTPNSLKPLLKRSSQAIKVKLLDQTVVAGIGNIYASEALFRAGVSPLKPAARLRNKEIDKLHGAIRSVLHDAVAFGSTLPLDWSGKAGRDGLFYYGAVPNKADYDKLLLVYGRAGERCSRCPAVIRRIVQAARSTFYCPRCQT